MDRNAGNRWTRVVLIAGALLSGLGLVPFAMISMPGVSLDTGQGLAYLFILPLAGFGMVFGLILLFLGLLLWIANRYK